MAVTGSADVDALLGFPAEEVIDEGETTEPSEPADSEVVEEPGDADQDVEPSEEAEEEALEEEPEEGEPEEEPEEGEPEEEPEERLGPREARLAKELSELAPYRPLIDMVKSNPEIARDLLARQLGLAPKETAPAARPTVSAEERKQREEAWLGRLKANPAQALDELMSMRVEESTAPMRAAAADSVIESYKARQSRGNGATLFSQIEPIFDEIIARTDRRLILGSPQATLNSIRFMAIGAFVEDQRAKADHATKDKPLTTGREKPRQVMAPSRGNRPASAGAARRTRQLNDDERRIMERYGEDAAFLAEEEEERETPQTRSPWR